MASPYARPQEHSSLLRVGSHIERGQPRGRGGPHGYARATGAEAPAALIVRFACAADKVDETSSLLVSIGVSASRRRLARVGPLQDIGRIGTDELRQLLI